MTTMVITARTPSVGSFDSSNADADFDFSVLDDAVDGVRGHEVPVLNPESSSRVGADNCTDASSSSPGLRVSKRESDARTNAVIEATKTITSLREELRDANRKLQAYRGARMASRLVEDGEKCFHEKSALQLIDDNPALAIPMRLKQEKVHDAQLLEAEKQKLKELKLEVEKSKQEAELHIQKAKVEAAIEIKQSKEEVRKAQEKIYAQQQQQHNLNAALVDTRSALDTVTSKAQGFERESIQLYDKVVAHKSAAEEARRKALSDASAARASARDKLFAVLRNMGERNSRLTQENSTDSLESPRIDPYAYAQRLRDMRVP